MKSSPSKSASVPCIRSYLDQWRATGFTVCLSAAWYGSIFQLVLFSPTNGHAQNEMSSAEQLSALMFIFNSEHVCSKQETYRLVTDQPQKLKQNLQFLSATSIVSVPQIQLWCWHCAPCSYYYYLTFFNLPRPAATATAATTTATA